MLNGSALNSATLNGVAKSREPVYVVRGQGFTWRLRVLIGGVDLTAQLTGSVSIDREEGAAGVASFDLYLPAADGPVVPTNWIGKTVAIDYLSTSAGVTTQARRFTGYISEPRWSPRSRVLSCECSDQRQQRVEALSIATIDSLIVGYWSEDVFEPVEGRSRWDYALERLSTVPGSLDCSPTGGLRVTSWFAAERPHYVFGAGTTLDDSVSVELAQLDRQTNRVEIEFSYRYPRLWQRNQIYGWKHPGTGGAGGLTGFCAWRQDSTELPTREMVDDATQDAGMSLVAASYYALPASHPDPCGTGQPWINTFDNLLLGVNWTGARRWAQTVTEQYTLILTADPALPEDKRIVQRESYTLAIEDGRADSWESDPITDGVSGATDLDVEARRTEVLRVALNAGRVRLLEAQRGSSLTWRVPASLAVGVDLIHTLELNDQGATGRGKCVRVVDSYDLASGEAITTLSIATMRGAVAAGDPLILPARLSPTPPPAADNDPSLIEPFMPTQLGGKPTSGEYDEASDGFSGQYDNADPSLPVFPRNMKLYADEIPAADRDELKVTGETVYVIGFPNDPLEL